MSCNLTRAAGAMAGLFHARARGATIRSHLISVAARISRHGRSEITLHLPEGWHRDQEWLNLSVRLTRSDAALSVTAASPLRAWRGCPS